MKLSQSILATIVILLMSVGTCGQNSPVNSQSKELTGAFPEAHFESVFQKHLSNNSYSPFFSWEEWMSIDLVSYRKERHTTYFKNLFQTVGARSTNSKVNITGNSYLVEGRYQYQFPEEAHISFGVIHLSSHLTQDLEKLVTEETRKGRAVPSIKATDLNVFFVEGFKKFTSFPLQPELRLRIQPVGFRFHGGRYNYDQPFFLETKIITWESNEKRIIIATQHEWGDSSFNDYSIRLELFSKNDKEGKLQFFIAGSSGTNLHVSPNIGWHRNGIRTGLKLVFWAH